MKTNCTHACLSRARRQYGNPEWVQYKAPAGAVVVENHTNGQILAMASYPTFDNRWMEAASAATSTTSCSREDRPGDGKADPDQSILVNRAVQGNYNLGSTIKPFVAWSAMHAGIIGPNEEYLDQGSTRSSRSTRRHCQHNGGSRAACSRTPTQRAHRPVVGSTARCTVADALAVSQRHVLLPPRRAVLGDRRAQRCVDPTLKGKST